MSLIGIIIALVILGLILYLVSMLPIDARIKNIINVVAVVFVIIWLLQAIGAIGDVGVPHVK